MRANGVEAAIARYREAREKKDAHNRNCTKMGSAYLEVLLYHKISFILTRIIELNFLYF